ncbi:hypothetical protein F4808DRAFT_139483 [Astrocystis sublimbata]|nr:hypothetical protein F4808DRAFT_139483 [Astrocystis sublimbata]
MARQPGPETWPRWAPHQPSWSALPVGALPHGFVMEQHYNVAPLMSQYPVPSEFVYNSYNTPEVASPTVPSTKQYLSDRAVLDIASLPNPHGIPEPLEGAHHMPVKQPLSPVIKSEPQLKSEPQPAESLKNKAISPNTAEGRAPNPVFATGIDRLMKIIQQKKDGSEEAVPAQPKSKTRVRNSSAVGAASRRKLKTGAISPESTEKPHACQRKKCHKRFSQITHLHIHDLAHTGEQPHQCGFAGCYRRFTQKGNLRTHERRHLGIRPFKCHVPGCTRAFPQKGNLSAHLETHFKRNTFRCILASCGKTFSSRGNLKTHQNNYHEKELSELELKFSSISIDEMNDNDRELWDYFSTIHKNSNKGIKGRGKECRVELVPHHPSTTTASQQYSGLQSPVEIQHHSTFSMSHGLVNSMGFGHFGGMQRATNSLGQEYLVTRGGAGAGGGGGGHAYDAYEMDQSSISSGTITPASSPGGMYDDHHHHQPHHHHYPQHHRVLPFHDRMY